jgi:SET domain-containing protein
MALSLPGSSRDTPRSMQPSSAGVVEQTKIAMPAHLEVRESTIPNAGKGMFAKRRIEEAETIGRYRGRRMTASAADHLPASHKPYLLKRRDGMVIDGYSLSNRMRWANHSLTPNAYFAEKKGKVLVIALEDIEEGDEVFIDYTYDPTQPDKSLITSYCKK